MILKAVVDFLKPQKSTLGLFLVIIYFILILYNFYYTLNCAGEGLILCGFGLSVALLGPWLVIWEQLQELFSSLNTSLSWLIAGLLAIFNTVILYYLGFIFEKIYNNWVIKRKNS